MQNALNLETLFAALAVLGQAEHTTLARLVDGEVDQATITQLRQYRPLQSTAIDPAQTIDTALQPPIVEQDDWLVMAPAVAIAYLQALQQADFLHFRQLHERAITVLSAQLRQGKHEVEPTFAAVFKRLAEPLLNQAPQQLFALLDQVQDLPLSPPTSHYRSLFLAIALRNLERYADALSHFAALLAEADLDLEVQGRALNAQAITYFWQGQLQQALDGYHASLAIWQRTGNQVQEGLVRLNLGAAAYELHDYPQAEVQLRQAEQLLHATKSFSWLAAVQNELGLVYRDQGRWSAALACFQQSLAQRQAEGSEHRVGVILNNIGEVRLLQGQWGEAERAFTQSLAKMTVDNVRIDAFINLGLLQQLNSNLTEAEHLFETALATAQLIDRRDILPTIHYRLADLYQQQGEVERALTHLQSGISLIEARRMPLRDEGLKISLLGRWQQLYELATLLYVQQQRPADALACVERARARAFLDMLVQSDPTTDRGSEAPLGAAEIQHALPANAILIEFFATGLPGAEAALLAKLPPTQQALRHHLLAPEQLLAFVISAQEIQVVHLTLKLPHLQAQHFNRADGRLRGITPMAGQPLRPLPRWRDLGLQLLQPLQPYLQGKSQIFLVPHGTLHYLPLHALLALDSLTGVAQTTVSYAPSASILFAHRQPLAAHPPDRQQALPDLATCLAIGVDSEGLAHAEAEASWIAGWLRGTTLLGAAATPAAVCEALADYAVIHFSCHGRFRQRQPMASALVLAGGELTAAALLQQVQLQAELVTLSACDTGLSEIVPGDELMGLTRAFLGCGARSLLVTLWPVHEIPTRLLMEQFYQSWRQGATKAAALGAAQRYVAALTLTELQTQLARYGLAPATIDATLALFQQMWPGPQPFAHPYYWAPFLLIGDPR